MDATSEVELLWPIQEYVRSSKATIMDYISGILILKTYTGAYRMEGFSRFLSLWDQAHGPKQEEADLGSKRKQCLLLKKYVGEFPYQL